MEMREPWETRKKRAMIDNKHWKLADFWMRRCEMSALSVGFRRI